MRQNNQLLHLDRHCLHVYKTPFACGSAYCTYVTSRKIVLLRYYSGAVRSVCERPPLNNLDESFHGEAPVGAERRPDSCSVADGQPLESAAEQVERLLGGIISVAPRDQLCYTEEGVPSHLKLPHSQKV